mgnify:CR=1 FL=1
MIKLPWVESTVESRKALLDKKWYLCHVKKKNLGRVARNVIGYWDKQEQIWRLEDSTSESSEVTHFCSKNVWAADTCLIGETPTLRPLADVEEYLSTGWYFCKAARDVGSSCTILYYHHSGAWYYDKGMQLRWGFTSGLVTHVSPLSAIAEPEKEEKVHITPHVPPVILKGKQVFTPTWTLFTGDDEIERGIYLVTVLYSPANYRDVVTAYWSNLDWFLIDQNRKIAPHERVLAYTRQVAISPYGG